jgi:SSS family solute:Na+ symporter/sodium/proline symporter
VATAINDFIQGIIMLGGSVLMVIFVMSNPAIGGVSAAVAKLGEIGTSTGTNLTGVFGPAPLRLLGLVILTSFGTWGMPQMIHKFYAIRDEKAIRRGAVISTIFALVIGGAAYFTGAFGRVFLENKVPAGGMDAVMPTILAGSLPDAMFGIILVLMLSASMSTLAALVLVSSSVISIDFVKGFLKPSISQKSQMGIMRLCCALFIALSFLMAIWPNPTVDVLMALSWGLISGMFLAPYLFGLLWKGTTKAGAWAGFATGFLAMAIGVIVEMPKVGNDFGKLFMPGIGSVAMVLSVIAVPLVSLLTKKQDAAQLATIFGDSEQKNGAA